MLFLTNNDVKEILTIDTCLEAVEESTRGIAEGTVLPQEAHSAELPLSDKRTSFDGVEGYEAVYNLNTGGVVFDMVHRMAVLRIYSSVPGFTEMHGLARRSGRTSAEGFGNDHPGFILLFDLDENRLVCTMQERDLQTMRVGAVQGLGVKYMAREDAHTIGIIGSGWIARPSLAASCRVRDIRLAKIFSPNPDHRQKFADQMSAKLGIEVRAVSSAEEATRGSDILVSATNTALPTFDPEWVEVGAHVACIHGREYDERMCEKADIIAWGYPGARETAYGAHAYADSEKTVSIVDIRRTERWDMLEKYTDKRVWLTDIVTGKAKGRTDDRQITFCPSPAGGTAGIARFAILAPRVYQMAKKQEVGQLLPDEWFVNSGEPY